MSSVPVGVLLMWVGSEVAEVRDQHGGVYLRLAAAAVQPDPLTQLGCSTSRRFVTGVQVWLLNVRAASLDSAAFGAVAEATLTVTGRPMLSMPVPWHIDEAVHLILRFAQGAELVVQAQGLRVQLSPDSRCVDYLSC